MTTIFSDPLLANSWKVVVSWTSGSHSICVRATRFASMIWVYFWSWTAVPIHLDVEERSRIQNRQQLPSCCSPETVPHLEALVQPSEAYHSRTQMMNSSSFIRASNVSLVLTRRAGPSLPSWRNDELDWRRSIFCCPAGICTEMWSSSLDLPEELEFTIQTSISSLFS